MTTLNKGNISFSHDDDVIMMKCCENIFYFVINMKVMKVNWYVIFMMKEGGENQSSEEGEENQEKQIMIWGEVGSLGLYR